MPQAMDYVGASLQLPAALFRRPLVGCYPLKGCRRRSRQKSFGANASNAGAASL